MNKIYALLIASGAAAFSAAALADPPTLVGRLSLIDGAASIRHNYDQQWSVGGVNYPVIAGDAIWSDQNSRTEVEIGPAEARLDEATEMDIDRLDGAGIALRVPQGVVNLTVRYVPPGGLQLLTSVGQISIQTPGEYHVDAGRPSSPPTQLLLGPLSGGATFSGLRGVVELSSGQGAMVPPDQSTITVVAIYPTPFDQWAESRAAELAASQTVAYVSPEVTGYQDLDNYGEWEPVPDYGMAWFPTRVEIGWAPYRYGHWDYVRPWGWTWIDSAPWGFAPFHYGRWAEFDGRWGWIPGERREHPCYAPALVAFVGGTPGEHMDAGIGWVPLGPHEAFHPYYAHSDTYVMNINRAHFHDERDFREREAHWHGPDATVNNFANHAAVTQVSAATFSGGQPVHQNLTPPTGGPRHGPTPVVSDFSHLPQPAPRPLPVAMPPTGHPMPGTGFPRPGPQPQQSQPYPQPVAVPHPAMPLPSHPAAMPQAQPERPERPPQQVQPVQQYHAPQQVQPAPQFHPQPAQQPRPQAQPQHHEQAPQREQEKDSKRDR